MQVTRTVFNCISFFFRRVMDSEDSEAREDSASEDSHPSTDASEDSVEVRVGGVTLPPPPPDPSRASSYSPKRSSYSPPGRSTFSPFITLSYNNNNNNSSVPTPRLPPKLRKCYNILANNHHQSVSPRNKSPEPISTLTAATYTNKDNNNVTPSSLSKRTNSNNSEEIQSHPRRRKLAEPRRLCSDAPRKRPHSPFPDVKTPQLSPTSDIPSRPVKQARVSSPESTSPVSTRASPNNYTPTVPPVNLASSPLIHPSLLSPLVRPPLIPPNLSPPLPSSIAPHLLSQGWTAANNPYQHYSRLLGSVLPNPLALLPGGLPIPPYHPILPLLQIPHQQPPQSPSPQPSSPKSNSILPSPLRSDYKRPSDSFHENEEKSCDEPVSLVKREESKPRSLFSVISLVEKSSEEKPDTKPPIINSAVSKHSLSPLPSKRNHVDISPSVSNFISPSKIKIKTEPSSIHLQTKELPATTSRLTGTPRPTCSLESTSPSLISNLSPSKLCASQLQQQQQQQLLKQKQRNYKNMTRERRIEANARERTRVHTISSAYEKLRQSVPSYSHNQKLSKLSILRIAASYILTLTKLADDDTPETVAACTEDTTRTIQFEGRAKKKRDD